MAHHSRHHETAKAPTKAPIQYLREALAYFQQFSDADIKCSKTYENISKIKRELNKREDEHRLLHPVTKFYAGL